jgi:hypothetical protein
MGASRTLCGAQDSESISKEILMRHAAVLVLIVLLALPHPVFAQSSDAQIWRSFVEKIDLGTTLKVRLKEGQRVKATLVQVSSEAIVLKPKTRVPVPPQSVPWSAIESIEIDRPGGIGPGKAIAIGIASGVGAFFGMVFIALAMVAD